MRLSKKLLFVMLFGLAFNACQCDEELKEICAPEESLGTCIVTEDGWVEVSESEIDWVIGGNSKCRLGQLVCNNRTLDLTCEGYVGNSEEQVCNQIDDDCDGEIDEPQFEASEEACNGLDDNCDGLVDNLPPSTCWTGRPNAIFNEQNEYSICEPGLKYCEEGSWSECRDQVLNDTEFCDGIDNDCDGIIDTDSSTEGQSCGPSTNRGSCVRGVETCIGGESICVGATHPSEEACDDRDNDCDGSTDEDLFQLCITQCGQGFETCTFGEWGNCSAPQPTLEICDGFDNDCDGEIDEDCPCITGVAQTCVNDVVDDRGNPTNCGVGVQVCEDGVWSDCTFWAAVPEDCNNHDDDCDGVIDDYRIDCGDPETAGTGLCKLGQQDCIEGQWSECVGNISPEEEVCDNKDNDCDGLVDEELDPDAKVDMCFVIDISGSMCPYIEALKAGIASYMIDLQGTEHLFCLIAYPEFATRETLVLTIPPLVDAATFTAVLASLTCDGGDIEPTYDVLKDLTDPLDPLAIGWRSDATPYVVVVTDENFQTLEGTDENDVAYNTTNCQIGNCEFGDRIEIFIIASTLHFAQVDTITFSEPARLFDILPAEESRYEDIFHDILTNVCIYNE